MATTADGTDYARSYIYPVSAGVGVPSTRGLVQRISFLTPVTDNAGDTVLIYCHGAGGADTEFNIAALVPLKEAAMDAGWVIVEAFAGSDTGASPPLNNWGNDLGRSEYEKAWLEMTDRFAVDRTVILGRSMGGLCGSWLATSSGVVTGVTAVGFNAAVVNLRASYDLQFASNIRTAYGIAGDGSDYDTLTAGHDPALFPSSAWAGLRTRWYYGTQDTTVPPADHVLTVQPIVAAGALSASTLPVTGGDHSSVEVYGAMADLVEWVDGTDPPEIPVSGVVDVNGDPVTQFYRATDGTPTPLMEAYL